MVAATDHLDSLVAWARRNGVARLTLGTLSIELGPAPDVSPQLTPEEERERARASERNALREEHRVRFAHVGGLTLSDAQIDAALGYAEPSR